MACGSPNDRRASEIVGKLGDRQDIVATMGRGSSDGDGEMIGPLQDLEAVLIQIGKGTI